MKMIGNTKIIGIDHGYGNMKTENFCFKTGVATYDYEPLFTKNLLVYDGRYYLIGEGHKAYTAEKMQDKEYYVLTLAAIAMELHKEKFTEATIHIAAGFPLTWVSKQKEQFCRQVNNAIHAAMREIFGGGTISAPAPSVIEKSTEESGKLLMIFLIASIDSSMNRLLTTLMGNGTAIIRQKWNCKHERFIPLAETEVTSPVILTEVITAETLRKPRNICAKARTDKTYREWLYYATEGMSHTVTSRELVYQVPTQNQQLC